jgi:hydroxypyruvate isomerase
LTCSINIGLIGHFHTAGNPGRHELWKGEINYREVFKAIAETSYNGFIGLEYKPTMPIEESLSKTRSYIDE